MVSEMNLVVLATLLAAHLSTTNPLGRHIFIALHLEAFSIVYNT